MLDALERRNRAFAKAFCNVLVTLPIPKTVTNRGGAQSSLAVAFEAQNRLFHMAEGVACPGERRVKAPIRRRRRAR
jgi:hypothetical protein